MNTSQKPLSDPDTETPLAKLKSTIERGQPPPDLGDNPALSLAEISVLPEVFQPREQGERAVSDEFHVGDLVKQIEARGDRGLDPVVVFWSGEEWLVVDGHHRLEAYRQSEAWGGKPVPVEVFAGGLDEAILSSVELNSKVNLQFDRHDRMDAAWRLVCLTEGSQKDVEASTGVKHRSYYNMKKRRDELLKALPDERPETLARYTWGQARRLDLDNIETLPERDEDWERKLAAEWKRRLQETFGNRLTKNPEVFAMAIRELNSGLPQMLMDSNEWSDVRDDLWDAWEAERERLDDAEF